MDLMSRRLIEAFIEDISIFDAGFGEEAVASRLRFPKGTVIDWQYQHLHGLLLGLANDGCSVIFERVENGCRGDSPCGKKETGSPRVVWHFLNDQL